MKKYLALFLLLFFVAAMPKAIELNGEELAMPIKIKEVINDTNSTINQTSEDNQTNETQEIIDEPEPDPEELIDEEETEETINEEIDEEESDEGVIEEILHPITEKVVIPWNPNIPTGAFEPQTAAVIPDPKTKIYVKVNGKLIATKDESGMKFYYLDILGTPRMIIDSQTSINTKDYSPYGMQIIGTKEEGVGYTGHLYNKESELIYAGARYYDPNLRIFISPDPIFRSTTSTYAYANNNPINYIDPDGNEGVDVTPSYKFGLSDPFDSRYVDNARKIDANARKVGESVKASLSFSVKGSLTDEKHSFIKKTNPSKETPSNSPKFSFGGELSYDSEEGFSDSADLEGSYKQVSVSSDDESTELGIDFGLADVSVKKSGDGMEASANSLGLAGISFEVSQAGPDSSDFTKTVSFGPSKEGSLLVGPLKLQFSIGASMSHSLTQRKANVKEEEQ